jgi:sporulation protein YlmC with PRC-barrel domain
MKHVNRYSLTLATAAASAALMCGPVAAQERSATPAPPAPRAQNQAAQDRNLSAGNVHASHLIGAQVKTSSGQDVGEVEDLIVSANGNVRTAVLSVGGLFGIGAKQIGVPYKDFSASPDGKTLFVNLTEQQLESYPEFDEKADDLHAASRTANPAIAPAPTSATAAQREHDAREAERNEAARDANTARTTPSSSTAARTDTAPASEHPARMLKASEQPAKALLGADVVDSSNAKIGEIKDLIVSAGRQAMAVLAIGKPAVGGRHLVAVPLDDLTIQRDLDDPQNEPDRVQTKLTVAQLEAMPEFRYE